MRNDTWPRFLSSNSFAEMMKRKEMRVVAGKQDTWNVPSPTFRVFRRRSSTGPISQHHQISRSGSASSLIGRLNRKEADTAI